jgi:hypothetical protein
MKTDKRSDVKFESIKKEYEIFYRDILSSGKIPQRVTPAGFWAPTSAEAVRSLFQEIGLSKYPSFVDLGSGDGVVTAVASLFTESYGIESDERLHSKSAEIKEKLDLKCDFLHADFLSCDLSAYSVIFISPDDYFYKLERKLQKEMKGILVVAGNLYVPLNMKLKKEIEVQGRKFLVYKK